MKNFRRALLFMIFMMCSASAQAITRYEFLTGLLDARGLDWSSSPEAEYEDPGGFMLRTGYVTDEVTNLDANVTRREALRWCIESLGLSFEAELLADYPSGFKDANSLTSFERGCLVVASNMNPVLFTKSDNFRGSANLTAKEAQAVYERIRKASTGLTLDMIRNPVEGLRVFIHREGVPTGIPNWRVYADGIPNKNTASGIRGMLKGQGIDANITQAGGSWGFRTNRLEDYNLIRRLTAFLGFRNYRYRVLPVMTNTNTRIVPRFWIMLTIDPTHWKIKPITSRNGATELASLSRITSQNGARASVNAGFFAVTKAGRGYPIGALRIDGSNLSAPYDGRACMGWNDDDEAVFAVASEDVNEWYDMSNIIQAGPMLLDEGQPARSDEGFNSAFISARHPRSAAGLNENGEWVFLVVDGRNGMHSSGATISELTEILRNQRILYALNLDGGGSTEIIIDGKIYNQPSDGYERMISYALGAVPLE